MSGRIEETQGWSAQLRVWEQANERRDLVLTELTERLARQAERDRHLLRKLETARARLDAGAASGHMQGHASLV